MNAVFGSLLPPLNAKWWMTSIGTKYEHFDVTINEHSRVDHPFPPLFMIKVCSLEQRHSQGHCIPSQYFNSITNWGRMGENCAYWRFNTQSCWILTACLCSKFSHRDVLIDGASKIADVSLLKSVSLQYL